MNTVYLLIGGNMGDKKNVLERAKAGILKDAGQVVRQSSLYQTAAWGLEEQAPFLNQALEIKTTLPAAELLKTLLSIEEKLGRQRELRYGPRIIDIDILLFNHEIIKEEGLVIPHPQLPARRFALVPLQEIAPDYVHPVLKKTVFALLEECPDTLDVQKIS